MNIDNMDEDIPVNDIEYDYNEINMDEHYFSDETNFDYSIQNFYDKLNYLYYPIENNFDTNMKIITNIDNVYELHLNNFNKYFTNFYNIYKEAEQLLHHQYDEIPFFTGGKKKINKRKIKGGYIEKILQLLHGLDCKHDFYRPRNGEPKELSVLKELVLNYKKNIIDDVKGTSHDLNIDKIQKISNTDANFENNILNEIIFSNNFCKYFTSLLNCSNNIIVKNIIGYKMINALVPLKGGSLKINGIMQMSLNQTIDDLKKRIKNAVDPKYKKNLQIYYILDTSLKSGNNSIKLCGKDFIQKIGTQLEPFENAFDPHSGSTINCNVTEIGTDICTDIYNFNFNYIPPKPPNHNVIANPPHDEDNKKAVKTFTHDYLNFEVFDLISANILTDIHSKDKKITKNLSCIILKFDKNNDLDKKIYVKIIFYIQEFLKHTSKYEKIEKKDFQLIFSKSSKKFLAAIEYKKTVDNIKLIYNKSFNEVVLLKEAIYYLFNKYNKKPAKFIYNDLNNFYTSKTKKLPIYSTKNIILNFITQFLILKITNNINETKCTFDNDIMNVIKILFDLKKAGDWGQALYCSQFNYKYNKDNKDCIFVTIDLLAALRAILCKNVTVLFNYNNNIYLFTKLHTHSPGTLGLFGGKNKKTLKSKKYGGDERNFKRSWSSDKIIENDLNAQSKSKFNRLLQQNEIYTTKDFTCHFNHEDYKIYLEKLNYYIIDNILNFSLFRYFFLKNIKDNKEINLFSDCSGYSNKYKDLLFLILFIYIYNLFNNNEQLYSIYYTLFILPYMNVSYIEYIFNNSIDTIISSTVFPKIKEIVLEFLRLFTDTYHMNDFNLINYLYKLNLNLYNYLYDYNDINLIYDYHVKILDDILLYIKNITLFYCNYHPRFEIIVELSETRYNSTIIPSKTYLEYKFEDYLQEFYKYFLQYYIILSENNDQSTNRYLKLFTDKMNRTIQNIPLYFYKQFKSEETEEIDVKKVIEGIEETDIINIEQYRILTMHLMKILSKKLLHLKYVMPNNYKIKINIFKLLNINNDNYDLIKILIRCNLIDKSLLNELNLYDFDNKILDYIYNDQRFNKELELDKAAMINILDNDIFKDIYSEYIEITDINVSFNSDNNISKILFNSINIIKTKYDVFTILYDFFFKQLFIIPNNLDYLIIATLNGYSTNYISIEQKIIYLLDEVIFTRYTIQNISYINTLEQFATDYNEIFVPQINLIFEGMSNIKIINFIYRIIYIYIINIRKFYEFKNNIIDMMLPYNIIQVLNYSYYDNIFQNFVDSKIKNLIKSIIILYYNNLKLYPLAERKINYDNIPMDYIINFYYRHNDYEMF